MFKSSFVLLLSWGLFTAGAETLPPSPPYYFNDFASVVSRATARQLNQTLEQLDKETTTQIVVAIYPKMQTETSIEDYTFRIAEKWRVGQKSKDNGVVLFVFIQDRQMFIQVGYGLEAVLSDALAKQIIENEIKPAFQQGDYDRGLTQGVNALLRTVKGTYTTAKNTDKLVAEVIPFIFIFFFLLLLTRILRRRRRGFFGGPIIWTSRGSGSWGGGGGFSGGGGGFGGGGAGGRW